MVLANPDNGSPIAGLDEKRRQVEVWCLLAWQLAARQKPRIVLTDHG